MQNSDEDLPPPAPLSRAGRRASISMPQGLDLLLKIAEYSWQSKPPVNSSFDDLAEAGVADACPSPLPPTRRIGQVTGPSRSGLRYEPVHSEDSETSDFSEVESPVEVSPPPESVGTRRPRRVISFDPKGRPDPDDDTVINLKPLAKRRNSGIIPLKIADSNFMKSDPDVESEDETTKENPETPTSSSLSSLLRKKLHSMPIPGIFRKKRPRDYKLQTFVAILFLIIILLVGSIYVIHQEKELQKSYYDRIRFSGKDRKIRVSNFNGHDVLIGVLGTNLAKKDKAWPCLVEDQRQNHTCMEWMDKARLYLRTKQNPELPLNYNTFSSNNDSSNLGCYEIFWQSLRSQFELKDCYDLGEKWGGHFYGGGEIPGSNHWPLNKTNVPYSPFLTGNKVTGFTESEGDFQWGRTLRRFFVNSDGAAIQVSEDTPLHVSINENGDRKLCIGARLAGYGIYNSDFPMKLNYTICTGGNVLDTSELLADKDIGTGLKHEDVQVTRSLAQSPIWRILPETINHGNGSESALLSYTDRIAALHLSEGFILIDETWQKRIGDLEMDSTRFPTMYETLNITRRRGFKVALTIQPFFSTQSENYEEGLGIGGDGGIWLSERHPGKKKVPALTQYKNWTSVAVLDVTKPEAQYWIQRKVANLTEKYGIDALYIDLGTAYDLPQFYEFARPLSSSDYYKDLFLTALRANKHLRTIGVSSAVKSPKLPTFVSLSPTESSWDGLQSVIPNILTMGVAGYPFIIPGAIGGDFFSTNPNGTNRIVTSSKGSFRIPDRDLYIRWLELAHFLSVVQYTFLPSDYDNKVVEIATNMHIIRKNKLYPYIKKAIDDALKTGLPVIRPLWMIDPTDPSCLKVADEFTIGGDIIVAPVIRPGEERDIYLPKGIWKNELTDTPTKGEKWLPHYRVRDNQIPYFTKMADVADSSLF